MKRIIVTIALFLLCALCASEAGAQFPPPKPARITLSKNSMAGGGTLSGQIHLSGPAPYDFKIELSTSNSAAAKVNSATVAIRKGETISPRFQITTSRVTQNTKVNIIASIARVSISQLLDVTVRPDSINVVPSVIAGGDNATATLVLSGSPPSGARASVTSSNHQVLRFGSGPISVAQESATLNLTGQLTLFAVTTGTVSENVSVTISATYNGVTVTKTVVVRKPFGLP